MSGALVDGVLRAVAEAEGVDPDRVPEFVAASAARSSATWPPANPGSVCCRSTSGVTVTVTGSGVVLEDGTERAIWT